MFCAPPLILLLISIPLHSKDLDLMVKSNRFMQYYIFDFVDILKANLSVFILIILDWTIFYLKISASYLCNVDFSVLRIQCFSNACKFAVLLKHVCTKKAFIL